MIKWLIPLAILVLFEGIADIFAKTWSLKGGVTFAIISLASYLIANFFWLFALRNGSGLGKGSIIFSIASAVIAVLLGLIFYHEKTSSIQIIGIVFGLVALVLIFWE